MKLRHRAMWWCTWNGSLGLISIFDECDCADRRDARAKICGSRVRMLRMPATEPTAIKNVVGVWNFGRADRDRHVGRAKCMRGTTWAGAGAITEFVFWLSWVSGSAGHADCPGWSIIGHLQLQELTAGYCNRERRRHMQRALSVFINSLITACIHDYTSVRSWWAHFPCSPLSASASSTVPALPLNSKHWVYWRFLVHDIYIEGVSIQ